MLTNLGPQTEDTIHRMLCLVEGYDQTQAELAMSIAAARREGLLDRKGDGTWVLLERDA